MAAAAAMEPRDSLPQPAVPPGRKEPLASSNAAEPTVVSPNSLLFLPNKNKARPASYISTALLAMHTVFGAESV